MMVSYENVQRRGIESSCLDRTLFEVEAGDFCKLDLCVLLLAKQVSKRRSDRPGREDPCRNLVEERLEEMVIRPVD